MMTEEEEVEPALVTARLRLLESGTEKKQKSDELSHDSPWIVIMYANRRTMKIREKRKSRISMFLIKLGLTPA